jgi:hypothetical protein
MEHLSEEEKLAFNTKGWRLRIMKCERFPNSNASESLTMQSIWRPLVPVVREKPLALCDWRTVKSKDWELCDQIHHDRLDEAMYLKREEEHQWYWLPDQKDYELSLFVVWDSLKFKEGVQGKHIL